MSTILGRVDGVRAAEPGMSERIAAYVIASVARPNWRDTLADAFQPPPPPGRADGGGGDDDDVQQVWTTPLALVRLLDAELRERGQAAELEAAADADLRALRAVALEFVDERLRGTLAGGS